MWLGVALRRLHHARQPARRAGVGAALRGADLSVHRELRGMLAYGFARWLLGLGDRRPAARGRGRPRPRASAVPGAARVRLGLRRADRRRGGLRRRAGLPAARSEERPHVLAWLGVILVTLFLGITFLGHHYHVIPRRGGDGRLPARAADLRRRAPLLRDPGRHHADPDPGREHRPSPTSRASRTSWPATASCRASSPPAATGWSSPTAS